MKKLRYILAFGLIASGVIWSGLPGIAKQVPAPPRAMQVVDHLRTVTFENLSPGIYSLRTLTPNAIEIVAFRVEAGSSKFELIQQVDHQGERVEQFGDRSGALIAFNGGFFSINNKGMKHSVGFLSIDGKQQSPAWRKSGGYLVFNNENVAILPTLGTVTPKGDAVLQSKPMLIEPGGNWAMNTNRGIPRKRTLVCQQKSGDIIVLAITGGGLSLFEAGWLMRGEDVGGLFDCDSALALDGGGSTQIWVKGRPDLSFSGETPVQNAVVIRPQ